ncbi:hypothetical protein ACWF94_06830 [Streptomyces sp. NPDC055078]
MTAESPYGGGGPSRTGITVFPQGVDAFARADRRMFRRRAERSPEQTWLRAVEASAEAWVDHRSAE